MAKGKIEEIHYLRGLSIILILASHILYIDQESDFYFFVSAFFENSTLFFGFISGYLFHHLIDKYEYPSYLKRKFKNVLLPYIIISIPVICFRVLVEPSYLAQQINPSISSDPVVVQIIYYYRSGTHLVPFWYLPMISIFFLIAPIFQQIIRKPVLYWILPFLFLLAQVFPRDEFEDISKTLMMFGHFLFIYVFGMFSSQYQKQFFHLLTSKRKLLVILFIVVFIVSTQDVPFRAQLIYFQKVLALFVLIDLFRRLESSWFKMVFSKLANTSFGVYFIHFILILLGRKLLLKFFGHELPLSIFEWFVSVGLILVFSYLIVLLAKQILGTKSRLFIGS